MKINQNHNVAQSASHDSSMVFTGDCVITDYFSQPPISEYIRNIIEVSDYSFANLEAPIKSDDSTTKFGPVLTNPDTAPKILNSIGFNAVTLANNHTMDYGISGLKRTRNYCAEADLQTVGSGANRAEAIEPLIINIDNNDIAVFSLCEREFGIARRNQPGLGWIDAPNIDQQIRDTAKTVDIIVLVAHGGLEYVPLPPLHWQERLRSLVDAGADAIIAHHPHVTQGWEIYQKCPIFYSLGNFIFYISNRPSTRWAYIVSLNLGEGEIKSADITLVEDIDGKIHQMGRVRNPDRHWEHLEHVSETIRNLQSNPEYWYEIVSRIYPDRYEDALNEFGSGHLLSLFQSPISELDRLTRGIVSPKKLRHEKELQILNYIQSEAHREVIRMGLELQTGMIYNNTSGEIEEEVDELFSWVDERPERSTTEKTLRRFRTAISRIFH